jgi:uncharacterized protein
VSPRHGLSGETVERITGLMADFPAVERAVLFGSRAKGTHKRGSDIDLAISGTALDWRTVGRLYDALDDLMLPYRFSLILFDAGTDPDVTAHIERVGIVLFERGSAVGAMARS